VSVVVSVVVVVVFVSLVVLVVRVCAEASPSRTAEAKVMNLFILPIY
jgi:uncharacterized membrane protein SirB2